ncbi:hypothetical protein [Flagellimonas sp.]|uniref:hypothetical protein n=1 Tax=Flagellimonas sp. TaxID=2058762 RepID=UPI003B508ED1
MKNILFIAILMCFIFGSAQKIEYVNRLPFPDTIVSSELAMSLHNEHVVASILSVNPNASKPTYRTVIMESYDLGKNWNLRKEVHSGAAADPWIETLGDNRFIFTDISEGNRFHLQSLIYDNGMWHPPVSHGLGHDYATVQTDSGYYYIFSTQKQGPNMLLYVHKTKNGMSTSRSIEVFNNVDVSFKKPIFFDDKITIPFTLRGSWNGESKTPFNEMTSWLLVLDKQNLSVSAPSLITNLSGAKHHILIKGNNKLYYFYTDVERKELSVIMSSDLGKSWGQSKLIARSSHLLNLDAAVWHKNQAVVIFTNEESEGSFQKYVLSIDEEMNTSNQEKLGALSRPDQRNGWAAKAWPQGGDYCGLVSYASDTLYAMWSAAPNGIFNPYFAKITLK